MSGDLLPRQLSTLATVLPIITKTYGKGSMANALAAHLAEKIDRNDFDSRGREHGVMLTCWAWFSGGSTAESAARRIEEALS